MNLMLTVWLFFLGAALGSFSLVLAWRLHEKKDWIRGRSRCDSCKRQLSAVDLIPIVSFLVLRGRCRYCKKPIPRSVFLAELLLGSVTAGSWLVWPFAVDTPAAIGLFAVWIVVCTLMSALFWYDLRWFILPSKLVYSLLAAALVFSLLRPLIADHGVTDAVVMPLAAAFLLSGLFFVLHTVSDGKWIGFGDVRLAIPLGLLIGSPLLAWLALFAASTFGLVIALPGLLRGQRKLGSKMPFGPLLIIATTTVVLYGDVAVDWYRSFIGL